MKKFLIKLGLPLVALVMAIGGAFAFAEGNPEISSNAELNGRNLSNNCTQTSKRCTTDFNSNICMDGGAQLYNEDCSSLVYEIPQN